MSFEDYWKEIEKIGILARVAVQLLPNSFSPELKMKLIELKSEHTAMKC